MLRAHESSGSSIPILLISDVPFESFPALYFDSLNIDIISETYVFTFKNAYLYLLFTLIYDYKM